MCKSELQYWDSVYFGPALLFMNQYFDFFFPEYYVLWVSLVSVFIYDNLYRELNGELPTLFTV